MEAIVKLEKGLEALVAALDRQDANAIIDAAAVLRQTVASVEASDAWLDKSAITQELTGLTKLLDISRSTVKILTAINRHRVTKLA